MTKLFAIIGEPIAQVRSPEIFNRLFEERGVDAHMAPMLVKASGVAQSLAGLRAIENMAGLIITAPHKAAAARMLKSASERVRIAGVANALRPCPGGWEGDLFDGEGFVRGMAAEGQALHGARCALVGCGGAGAAIAFALLERKVGALTLSDIDAKKAEELVRRLQSFSAIEISIGKPDSSTDIAINATPLGMKENDPLPIAIESLRPGAVVADAIMKPPRTRLLIEAQKRGCAIHEGRHMLDNQLEALWSYFGLP